MGGLTQNTQEIVEGYKVIKTFGGESFELDRFSIEAKRNKLQNIKMAATKAISTPLIQLIAGFSLAFVIYFAGQQLADGNLTAGDFVSMLAMMIMMLKPLKIISNLNSVLQKGIAAAQSIFEILDEEKEIDDGEKTIANPIGKLEFKNVCFSYSANGEKVLNNISFCVNAGETVALVGRSGSGKSTITNCLMRFYNHNSGTILLDDIER